MSWLLGFIGVVGVGQFGYSVWFAYRNGRYNVAPGYPLLAHALHTLIFAILAAVLIGQMGLRGFWVGWLSCVGIVLLPFIHCWMLVRLERLGSRRAATDAGWKSPT